MSDELNKEDLFWDAYTKIIIAGEEQRKADAEKLKRQCSWNEYDLDQLKVQQLYDYSEARQKLINDLESRQPKPETEEAPIQITPMKNSDEDMEKIKKLWD